MLQIMNNETQLDATFRKIAEDVKKIKTPPSEDEMLELYSFYKQAMFGDCNAPKPSTFDLRGKYKWEAWNKVKGMDRNSAKKKYIEVAGKLITKYGTE